MESLSEFGLWSLLRKNWFLVCFFTYQIRYQFFLNMDSGNNPTSTLLCCKLFTSVASHESCLLSCLICPRPASPSSWYVFFCFVYNVPPLLPDVRHLLLNASPAPNATLSGSPQFSLALCPDPDSPARFLPHPAHWPSPPSRDIICLFCSTSILTCSLRILSYSLSRFSFCTLPNRLCSLVSSLFCTVSIISCSVHTVSLARCPPSFSLQPPHNVVI